jgi:hypothetical protein
MVRRSVKCLTQIILKKMLAYYLLHRNVFKPWHYSPATPKGRFVLVEAFFFFTTPLRIPTASFQENKIFYILKNT